MTQIKIEVPANDTIALNAFAEALQRIAAERDIERTLTESFTRTVSVGNESITETTVKPVTEQLNDVAIDALDKELDEVENQQSVMTTTDVNDIEYQKIQGVITPNCEVEVTLEGDVDKLEESPTNVNLDKAGIPWDGRIHSKGKSRLADDTWRLRKRPADKDEDEWSTYVESVKSELLVVQNAPSVERLTEQVNELHEQLDTQGDVNVPVTPPTEHFTGNKSVSYHANEPKKCDYPSSDTEAVTPPSAVVPPVAAVTPPTSLTPPQVREEIKEQLESGEVTINAPIATPPASESDVTTFPQLMKYITSDAAKRGATNDLVKQALVKTDPSLISIQLIGGRIDLIPQFIKNLEELIGE